MTKYTFKGKDLDIPIIQGGMGIGISLGNLAGHVMKEGGVGVISAAQPGYQDPSFLNNPIKANLSALRVEIQKARDISEGKGLLGVNIMVAGENYDVYAQSLNEMDIDMIISGAGLPLELPKFISNPKIALAPIISSGKAAMVLIRRWLNNYNRTPDLLIIEGPLAGGHLGFSWEQLKANTCQSLEDILEDVKQVLSDLKLSIPIAVAGGIFTGYDIRSFIQKGASFVQMATRFIATNECDASDGFKQALLDSKQEDIRFVISPSGYPGRAINNELVTQLMDGIKIKVTHCFNCLKPCNPATTPYCISDALIKAVQGDREHGLFFTGTNGYRLDKIVSVHQLITELMQQYNEVLV